MIEKSHRWQKTVVAAAAICLLGFTSTEASALSLGRISVQSALGETLRAEIDVPNITPEEAASLKANAAAPAAFVAAGLEYNAVMSGLQATLARKSDGRAFIRLTSERPINDPFVDMILEATWSSGRIVRDFTMLFDPPSLKQTTATSPTLPQISATATAPAVVTVPAKPVAAVPAAVAEGSRPSAPAKPAVAAPVPKVATKAEGANGQQLTVKAGDSASKIALSTKANDVSLDQMLVAMLRANPDAFLQGNLNRLRAGAVLEIPSADQAKSVSSAEASQIVVAQSKDFNEFRRNLANSAPKSTVEAADRKAAGSVEAKVDDKKSTAAAADKLTLSKGALKSKAEEAKIAKERADAEAATRAAELAKNIEDLKKLSSATAKAPATAPVPSASDAKTTPAAPALAVAAPKPPASEAATPAEAMASAPKPPESKPAVPAAPAAEAGLLDQLMEDPILPLAGGGLIALLGGFALYRRFKGKKDGPTVDSSFLESKLQPESFFGASGGQQVDTAQDAASGSSSMGYSNSQMGTPDDVDPVAEADVYLAYGRDMQAEEILKAALPANPERLAIHTKLLEIYAKRKDTAGFLAGANAAFKLTGADSPEWARICEMGLSIDPHNPLYQPGGASSSAFVAIEQNAFDQAAATQALTAQTPAPATDLDLDLDFSADETPPPAVPDVSIPLDVPATAADSNGLDFDVSGPAELELPVAAAQAAPELSEVSISLDDLSLDMPSPEVQEPLAELPSFEPVAVPTPAAAEPVVAKSNDGMLEFDLGSLSLDLDPVAGDATPGAPAEPGDSSLETKLALAEEFVSIGDHDGARALIEEVIAEATGDLRERAQRALANLS